MNRNSVLIKQYAELQQQFLDNRGNVEFRDYLKKRGMTKEIVSRFELGYNTKMFFHKNGDPLIGNNAITIPIRDFSGRIVAFQSRFVKNPIINGTEYRYFNSDVLPLVYEKKKWLYNIERVVTDYYDRTVYVVEGVFDLFSLAVAGIDNVVATIGNRLSIETTEMLIQYFDKVIFVLDKGDGGQVMIDFKNPRIWDIELYKVQVEDVGDKEYKDSNDLLLGGINIQDYFAGKIVKIEKEVEVYG